MLRHSSGCLFEGRSYVVAVLRRIDDPSYEVTAVGAHFPQTLNASSGNYQAAIASLKNTLLQINATMSRVVFMADTNTESPNAAARNSSHRGLNKTNAAMMTDLGLWKSSDHREPPSSTHVPQPVTHKCLLFNCLGPETN